MKIAYKPFTLELRNPFTLATSSRTTTPIVLLELYSEGLVGFGEASLPPYLGVTQEDVIRFLAKLRLDQFTPDHSIAEIMHYVDGVAHGNSAAKAAVDIALHDLYGKRLGRSWIDLWGVDPHLAPPTSFTIGIDSESEIRRKVLEAANYKVLKVKLGRETDRMIVDAIRSVSDTPLCVDVNQGWSDKHQALEMIHWLSERKVLFIEQPLPKEMVDETAWLTEHAPIPIIADESFQRLSDLEQMKGVFSGINIKLMKCTGMNEAKAIIDAARKENLKVMLGCMTETSCAISAAVQLSPMVDFADLDGHLLVSNDCFTGLSLEDGRVLPSGMAGLGICKIGAPVR